MKRVVRRVKNRVVLGWHRRSVKSMSPMHRPLAAASLDLMGVASVMAADEWMRHGAAGRRVVQRVGAFSEQASQMAVGSLDELSEMHRRLVDLLDAIDAVSDEVRLHAPARLESARRHLADFREMAAAQGAP